MAWTEAFSSPMARGIAARVAVWSTRAGVLASVIGVGLAASATWLAWRVRFHPPPAGALARSLVSIFGASGGRWGGYRACEAWAQRGTGLACLGLALLLVTLSVRALRSRWFRWLGWVPAIALCLVGAIGMFGATGAGIARASARCEAHPDLPGCQVSDKPPGSEPAVTKTEPEWLISVGGAVLLIGSFGSLFGAVVVGGSWLASIGLGVAGWLHPATPARLRGASAESLARLTDPS